MTCRADGQRTWDNASRLRVSGRATASCFAFHELCRALDGCPETQEATAERDRTRREPRPPECESGDSVGQPVDAEHHPARGDRDGDSHGDRDDECPAPAAASAQEDQRNGSPQSRSRGRMTAGERRPKVAVAGSKVGVRGRARP